MTEETTEAEEMTHGNTIHHAINSYYIGNNQLYILVVNVLVTTTAETTETEETKTRIKAKCACLFVNSKK